MEEWLKGITGTMLSEPREFFKFVRISLIFLCLFYSLFFFFILFIILRAIDSILSCLTFSFSLRLFFSSRSSVWKFIFIFSSFIYLRLTLKRLQKSLNEMEGEIWGSVTTPCSSLIFFSISLKKKSLNKH